MGTEQSNMTAIKWNGKNTTRVKEYIHDQMVANKIPYSPVPYLTFIPRRGSMMTEGLWKNIAYDDWPDETSAALFDRQADMYVPVSNGQWICFEEETFKVHDHEPG